MLCGVEATRAVLILAALLKDSPPFPLSGRQPVFLLVAQSVLTSPAPGHCGAAVFLFCFFSLFFLERVKLSPYKNIVGLFFSFFLVA